MIESYQRVYLDPNASRLLGAQSAPRRALFLDRDGVINIDHGYVHTAEQTQFIPGIFDLCRVAQAGGFLPVVITNQAGIARGLYSESDLLAYTRWMHGEFADRGAPLCATYYCPHHPVAGIGDYLLDCECRKPKPGMLLRAQADLLLDMAGSALIGDKQSDLAAAEAAGISHCFNMQTTDLTAAIAWLRALSHQNRNTAA